MVDAVRRGAPPPGGGAATQPGALQTLDQAIARLVGEQGRPGPLIIERAFASNTKELKEATEVLKTVAKQLPEGSPAAGAIARGLRTLDNPRNPGTVGRARQAAYVMEYAQATLRMGQRGGSKEDLARRLVSTELMPLAGKLVPDYTTGMVLENESQHAARYGLKEIATLLGDAHPISADILKALDQSERTGLGAKSQTLLANAIRAAEDALL